MIHLIDKNLNFQHRGTLINAVTLMNKIEGNPPKTLIIVGTKNLLRGWVKSLKFHSIVIYLTGFGRLYTEYGFVGKLLFFSLLIYYKLFQNLYFIVENEDDKKIINRLFPRNTILVSKSSGLIEHGFGKTIVNEKKRDVTFGYLARFDRSKQSHAIVEIARGLPPSHTIIIAGQDITGNYFTNQFEKLAKEKPNVKFLGFLNDKKLITDFFNSIDTLLYPTNREGLPMTLVESIYHETDFIASDVPGARDLATEFGRVTLSKRQFTIKSILKHEPRKYDKHQQENFKKYFSKEVEKEFYIFLRANLINKVSVYDYSNTNSFHRSSLLNAVARINSMPPQKINKISIFVGTRNMIKAVPMIIFRRDNSIINIVGFGRLYTDYGFFGRYIFNSIVWLHDRTNALAFIVEHETDKTILENFVKNPVYTTHGSGLDTTGFKRKHILRGKKLRIGYLSRFHKSKGSHEILKAAKNLPGDRELIIAGWDIRGKKYSREFQQISESKSNVKFLGRLDTREEVSQFFNRIDLFLSPSVREGGNIALQEAIWHRVPFLTTDVPGCSVLAQLFNCPMISMKNFGDKVLDKKLIPLNIDTSDWEDKIKPFMTKSVEKEYFDCLLDIVQKVSRKDCY